MRRVFRSAVSCLAAAALCPLALAQPLPFTEEAVARGIDFFTPVGPGAGRGMALVDLDGDRDPDLVALGGAGGAVGIWENDGRGNFIDRAAGSGVSAVSEGSGVVAADYDADGDLDLYVSCWQRPNRLLRNDGGFVFTDVTAAAGVADKGRGTGATWGDADGDGWLDLYVSNMSNDRPPTMNRLYRNLGNGSFEDVAPALGIEDLGLTWQAGFLDFDHDGDSDLYLNNDKCPAGNPHNYLLENTGGAFVDISVDSGTDACIFAMGLAIGDFDGDSLPDMYISNTPEGNPLFLNRGDGTFGEASTEAGVRSFAIGWGTVFFDFDNDGHNEIYLCNQDAPNRLYVHGGSFPAVDRAAELGVTADEATLTSYIVVKGDVDGDGDVDLVVGNLDDRLRLFINHEGSRRSWAKLRVVGEAPNLFAYGARVDLRIGERWQTRQVLGAGGFKSHDELTLHFGLDDAPIIDEIRVHWPGGETRTLTGYRSRLAWSLYPAGRLGDFDGNGQLDLADVFSMRLCLFRYPGTLKPGCEAGDMDGDGAMTQTDWQLFVDLFD